MIIDKYLHVNKIVNKIIEYCKQLTISYLILIHFINSTIFLNLLILKSMQDRQRNKLNMYVMTKDFLLASATITNKWTVFAALFASFTDYITEIFSVAGKQADDTSGALKSKSKVKKKLIDKMQEISEKCRAYAAVAEDADFMTLIKFMKGELQNKADADLVKTAGTLAENVLPKLALIADYDLTQANLDELLALKLEYMAIFNKPKSNVLESAKLTERLNVLFTLADAVLAKIDAIVQSARKSHPAFVDEYNRKRIIPKAAKRTRALQLTVLYDASGLPLPKANISIMKKAGGADLAKVVKRSGKQGRITNDLMEAGEYDYEVSFNGCITEKGSFFVNDGIMTEVTVRMKVI